MKRIYSIITLLFSFAIALPAQEILITETGGMEQVYKDTTESKNLLPFNDLNIEFGYVLYQAEVEIKSEESVLKLENVRDYAAVYLDNKLQGAITDRNKRLTLDAAPGKYTLRFYAENIGRITYGPEILDNSKGLFGSITLDGEEIENWIIIPLNIRDYDTESLQFEVKGAVALPSFHKGHFDIEIPEDIYLDISGWGMGEVWVNDNYIGSYWEEEKQQSIQIPAENLLMGKNEIIIFELKNNFQKTMRLSAEPVFK